MAVFKPFQAIRPKAEYASRVAALPYDVMSSDEAREMVKDNPYSFLHVDKAEIDLDPSVDLYDEKVYAKAAENLKKLQDDGICVKEEKPCFYLYRQVMGEHSQTGIVGCASIDDYLNNIIKKHELTRADKEADRIHHVDTCNANTGPIFLTFRSGQDIIGRMDVWMENDPLYDFVSEDGVRHTVWIIDGESDISWLREYFQGVPAFYIADGHHRAASAVKVGIRRREKDPDYTGEEEFNTFLAVLFPSEELSILDYNRVVKDLNGLSEEAYLTAVAEKFDVEKEASCVKPQKKHTVGMYLNHTWYRLTAREGTYPSDPVGQLDVSILQQNLLTPILGIGDPRKDARIDFIGGIRGTEELVRLVDGGDAVAFAMYPTTLDDLMSIADAGSIMPPKSTWFEPKLRSGLFIHSLE